MSAPDMPLWVYTPSTSKNISYSQGWTEPMSPNIRWLNFANYGDPPFAHTSTSPQLLNGHAQPSIAYNFTGTRVVVEATVLSQVGIPPWRVGCQIDGQNVAVPTDLAVRPRNGVALCDAGGLSPDQLHTLNLTVFPGSVDEAVPIYFDTIKVVPSSNTYLDNALVYMPHNATMITYDEIGWETVSNFGRYTGISGTKVVINFSGTKLRWYGFYDPSIGTSTDESRASFTLDQYPPVTFTIPSISNAPTATQIGLPHFTTVELPPGMHRLEVSYASTSGRPLGLHHLVIQNAPLPSAISSTAPQVPTVNASSTQNSSVHSASSGLTKSAIIAISVNVVIAGLVIIGFSIFFLLRRRAKARGRLTSAETARPYDYTSVQPGSTSMISVPRNPKMSTSFGVPGEAEGSSAASTSDVAAKGTHLTELPIRRGSLHIRSINVEERPPPPYIDSSSQPK